MAKQKRSDDWGFPRWRSYGDKGRGAARLRLCDREGCTEIGDRAAPKAPNSKDRWYFCEAHAAEYNKNWNYFAGLSPEEAERRAAEESRGAVTDLIAAVAVAQAQLGRVPALRPVGAPARESPVVRSLLLGHSFSPFRVPSP